MGNIIYAICALSGLMCSYLLIRSYLQNKTAFLFTSALCFFGLALNNVLLFVDLVILPVTIDLSLVRTAFYLGSVSILLVGFIWEKR